EISFFLFLFHRATLVVVDNTALAFASFGKQHLLNDFWQGGGARLDGAGKRVTTEGAEANLLHDRAIALFFGHAPVVDHNQRAIDIDNRSHRRFIQRHDGDVFQVNVLPDVELSPVGKRENANALPFVDLAVIQVP